MKHAFTVLLLLIGTTAFSQASKGLTFVDGWVKTNKGDTLRGQVCYENSKTGERMEKIYFVDANNSKKRMGAEKLASFGFDGRIYDFVDVGDGFGKVVMQRVIQGDITMFYAWFKSESSTPQKITYERAIFLKREGRDELFEVLERKFEKTMSSYFKGDEDIIQMIKENKWTANDMEKIVAAYNAK